MATHLPPLRPTPRATATRVTRTHVLREQLPRLYGSSECRSASRSPTPSPVRPYMAERDSLTATTPPLWPVADLRPDSARHHTPHAATLRVDALVDDNRCDNTRRITRFIRSAVMKHESACQPTSVVSTRPSQTSHDDTRTVTASDERARLQATSEQDEASADEAQDTTVAAVRDLFCQRRQKQQEADAAEVASLAFDESASDEAAPLSIGGDVALALTEVTQHVLPQRQYNGVTAAARSEVRPAETVYVDDEVTTRYRLWPTPAQRALRWLPYTEHYERQILESAAQQPWQEASRQGEQRAVALRGKLAAAAQSLHFMSDVTVRAQIEAAMHKALVSICKLHTPQLRAGVRAAARPAEEKHVVAVVSAAVHDNGVLSCEERQQLLRTCVDIATQHKTTLLQYSLWQMTQLWQQSRLVCAEWHERGVLQAAMTRSPLMQGCMQALCGTSAALDETRTPAAISHPLCVYALVALESHGQACQTWLQVHAETTLPSLRAQCALFAACEETYEGIVVQERRTWRRLVAYNQCCLMFAALRRDAAEGSPPSSAARAGAAGRRAHRHESALTLQAMQAKFRLCRTREDSPFCSYVMFRALDAVTLVQHDLAGRLVAAEATAWQTIMQDERLARGCTRLQDAEATARAALQDAEAAASAQLCGAMCATEMECLGREAAARLAESRLRATEAALAALVRDGYASKAALVQHHTKTLEALHKHARAQLYRHAVVLTQRTEDAVSRAQSWLAERAVREVAEREARLRYDIECAETSAARVLWQVYDCAVRDLAAAHVVLVRAEARRRALLRDVVQPEQAQRAQIRAECREAYATLFAPTLCRPVTCQTMHSASIDGLDLRRRVISSLRDFLDTNTIALLF